MKGKVIGSQAIRHPPKIWKDRSDVGFFKRPLGIHARTQKVLDGADHHYIGAAGNTDRSGEKARR